MPDRMSDAEVLGQTAEWLSRLADTIERATTGLADSIAQVRAEQGELRDELNELAVHVHKLEQGSATILPLNPLDQRDSEIR